MGYSLPSDFEEPRGEINLFQLGRREGVIELRAPLKIPFVTRPERKSERRKQNVKNPGALLAVR
jgi:hypothetical protein